MRHKKRGFADWEGFSKLVEQEKLRYLCGVLHPADAAAHPGRRPTVHRIYKASLFLGLLGVMSLSGCQRGPAPSTAPETIIVPVAHPVTEKVSTYVYYTGRTNAKDAVTIVPRVTGYLVEMPFKEGSDVKKGELLFKVDSRPYQAQFEAAQAVVAQNEATVKYAKATNERFQELNKKQKGSVSERELDQYQAQEEQANANLNLAKANLISAKLNLDWTKVDSPIDGHISRYFLTVGNLVNQDVTQLTTVVSMDPMYIFFDMDESTLLRIKRGINQGQIQPAREGQGFEIKYGLQGEDSYPHTATVNFVDNQVNPGTGSIPVRAIFPNPKPPNGTYPVLPGMFVRVQLPIGKPQDELLVIDRAVTSDQGIKYVYVVNAQNTVEARRVTVGPLEDSGLRVITQGLKPDDRVVVGSLQQVRPRTVVQPDQMTMPTLSNPAQKAVKAKAEGKAAGKAKDGK
jgi:membrane fusion protein, multidrug efflux system